METQRQHRWKFTNNPNNNRGRNSYRASFGAHLLSMNTLMILLLLFLFTSHLQAGRHMMQGDTAGGDLNGTFPSPSIDSVVSGYHLFISTSPYQNLGNYFPSLMNHLGIANVYKNTDLDPQSRWIAVFGEERTVDELVEINEKFFIGTSSVVSVVPLFTPSVYVDNQNIFISTQSHGDLVGARIYASAGTINASSTVTISVPGVSGLFLPLVSEAFDSIASTVSVRIQNIYTSSYTIFNADITNNKSYVTWAFGR